MGPQNSMAMPVLSWYQAGKPPTLGSLLVGPTRSSSARAGNATPSISTAADTRAIADKTPVIPLDCMDFMVKLPPRDRTNERWRSIYVLNVFMQHYWQTPYPSTGRESRLTSYRP